MESPTRSGSLLVTRPHGTDRYELRLDDNLVSFADFQARDDMIVVPYVETLQEHRGNGYAAHLMSGLLDDVRAQGERIEPVCSFAREYIRDRPEHHDLLAR